MNTRKIRIYIGFGTLWALCAAGLTICQGDAVAADGSSAEAEAYWKVATGRAQKIVDKLDIEDAAKAARVRDIIATQYRNLHDLQEERDAKVEELKSGTGDSKAKVEELRRETDLAIRELHYHFLAQLAGELDPARIDEVKDGMTYGVLPITYHRYTQLFPDLGEEHMRFIYTALVEAREFAMDEGSSEEKHKRFGKYKGRINNYVSKLGIDMKEAERALAEKEKAAKK